MKTWGWLGSLRTLAITGVLCAIIYGSLLERLQAEEPSLAVVKHAQVMERYAADVAAQENGLLKQILVTEGDAIHPGDLLATLEDNQLRAKYQQSTAEYEAARFEAESNIRLRHAQAVCDAAKVDYEQALEANKKVRGTFPITEIRELKLDWTTASLEVEHAAFEQAQARFQSNIQLAALNIAKVAVERCSIHTPLAGAVLRVHKHPGEWVQAGETLFRIVSYEALVVEGLMDGTAGHPGEVVNHLARVEVQLPEGRTMIVSGVIIFAAPQLHAGGGFLIRAAIENVQEEGRWLLFPGQRATITILKQRQLVQ